MLKTSRFIQDISDFYQFISKELTDSINEVKNNGYYINDYVLRDSLYWIICKELGLVYNLYNKNNINNEVLEIIYSKIKTKLKVPISILIKHYIKGPRIYGDNNEINIFLNFSLHHITLEIRYYFEQNTYGAH